MLDCCSLRYYGRGRAISLLSGTIIGPSNTCNQPTFSFSLPLPFFRTRAVSDPADRFLIFCHAGERNVSRNGGQGRAEFDDLVYNNTDLDPLAKVLVSFPLQRLRARNRK